MLNSVTVFEFFIIWGILSFALFVARLIVRIFTSGRRQREREHAKQEGLRAAAEEQKRHELIRKKEEAQNKTIELQKQLISVYEEKLSFVENPVLPNAIDGFKLVYEYDTVSIYVPNQDSFEKLEVGCKLSVRQDKGNTFDDRAVSLNLDGKVLAYLHRGKFQDMANDFLEREDGVIAFVTYLNRKKSSGQILLGFYRNPINAHLDADDGQYNSDDECLE